MPTQNLSNLQGKKKRRSTEDKERKGKKREKFQNLRKCGTICSRRILGLRKKMGRMKLRNQRRKLGDRT